MRLILINFFNKKNENIIKKNLRLTQSAYDSIFLAKARSKNYKKLYKGQGK